MKKQTAFLIVMMLISTSAFALAKRPQNEGTTVVTLSVSPLAQCYAQVDSSCKSLHGDPMNPNFPYSVKSQSNVTGVEYLKNADGSYFYKMPGYDPAKKTYDPVGFSQCVQPGYEACRSKN